ncbi:MAG: tRNA uridine-5-carboxymethylaminomethyl(34) synthesis GTPase MnmE [Deltaproteobacteria bacterium]|nr:tRNA uridine-5-carboxymethylaminomethyl(34) synthesis GTPase MnmE [Deltaproteobacteria bacterium]
MPCESINNDTIAAVSTPHGKAGIGIIRISGLRAKEIAKKIFRPRKPILELESHRLYLGQLIDPADGQMLDEVFLSYMKAPGSYTREDVVEINSHSGHVLLSKTLQIVIDEGARLARPGEFTFRAYTNGRIDLTQAEAVMDLINSRSERGLLLSSRQIRGELRDSVRGLRDKLVGVLARIEASIDFPEDEPGLLPREETAEFIERDIIGPVSRFINAYNRRKMWMEGVETVIVGRVNAGKSSLLNRLINEERSIVTSVPGTTRDIIESTIHLKGIPFKIMDTAGIREGKGRIEKIGIKRSEQKLEDADLALVMIDHSRPLNRDDHRILAKSDREKSLVVINKIDLPSRLDEDELNDLVKGMTVLQISTLTGEGIERLLDIIPEKVLEKDPDSIALSPAPNLRQKAAFVKALDNFTRAFTNLRQGLPLDIVAMDIREGADALAEITGETTNEDIYDKIFSDFCLGK